MVTLTNGIEKRSDFEFGLNGKFLIVIGNQLFMVMAHWYIEWHSHAFNEFSVNFVSCQI